MSPKKEYSAEELKALVIKHGSKAAAIKAIGIPKTTFYDKLSKFSFAARSAEKKGKSLSEFRQLYDKNFIVPKKIKETLKDLGASWVYEIEFAKSAGLSLTDIGNYRDQFSEHVVELKGTRRIWAGTKDLADKMRRMI